VATLDELKAFEKSIGVDHVCIAHGLSYGKDCSSLLYYLGQFRSEARGICVIDETSVTDDLLDSYHAAGIRSVRLDFFKHQAMNDLDKQVALIEATAARLTKWGPKGWSVQAQQPHIQYWPRLRKVAKKLPVPLVIDHMGLLKGESMAGHGVPDVTTTPEFAELLGALSDGNLWTKISAPYRNSYQDFEYLDLKPLVRKMVDANPNRVVWGSDWPHTQRHQDRAGKNPDDKEPFLKIDNARWIQSLSTWLSDEEWQAMWVDNPQELYDY
jgi:predicted TIM-barrel fold metal-dependent hydrolase